MITEYNSYENISKANKNVSISINKNVTILKNI